MNLGAKNQPLRPSALRGLAKSNRSVAGRYGKGLCVASRMEASRITSECDKIAERIRRCEIVQQMCKALNASRVSTDFECHRVQLRRVPIAADFGCRAHLATCAGRWVISDKWHASGIASRGSVTIVTAPTVARCLAWRIPPRSGPRKARIPKLHFAAGERSSKLYYVRNAYA
jgi:hypothetical protein